MRGTEKGREGGKEGRGRYPYVRGKKEGRNGGREDRKGCICSRMYIYMLPKTDLRKSASAVMREEKDRKKIHEEERRDEREK